MSPSSSAPDSARLVAAIAAGELRGDLLGELLGRVAQALGRVDDLADHAQLVGARRRHPLVAADEGHAHHGLDRHLRMSPIASIETTWPIETCGSKNCASDAAITMSASATQWKPPPAQMPFTAVMTGFHDLVLPRREVQVEVLDRLAVALHADTVARDLAHVDAGLERAALAGVHDDAHLGIVVERAPRDLELVAHVRVHRVELRRAGC